MRTQKWEIFILLPIIFDLEGLRLLIEKKSYHKGMKSKLHQHRSEDSFLAIFNSSCYWTDKQRLLTMGSVLPLCNVGENPRYSLVNLLLSHDHWQSQWKAVTNKIKSCDRGTCGIGRKMMAGNQCWLKWPGTNIMSKTALFVPIIKTFYMD